MIMFVHPYQNAVGRLIGVETRWTSAVLLVTAPKQRMAVLAAFVENKLKPAVAKFLISLIRLDVGRHNDLLARAEQAHDP